MRLKFALESVYSLPLNLTVNTGDCALRSVVLCAATGDCIVRPLHGFVLSYFFGQTNDTIGLHMCVYDATSTNVVRCVIDFSESVSPIETLSCVISYYVW